MRERGDVFGVFGHGDGTRVVHIAVLPAREVEVGVGRGADVDDRIDRIGATAISGAE